ncbi:hypothetical protein CI807_23245 [Pseudomonas sp. NS1(2017)]|nr:hypothetical protein CI807_23245 [Pseudomonas sp. NS1(2017)]
MLSQALRAAFDKLPEDAGPADVVAALKENRVEIGPHSSFRRDQNLMQPSVSLEAFIQSKGTYMPTTAVELRDLADALIDHTLAHPLGNFAGALSWAHPLSEANQRKVFDIVASNSADLLGLPLINPRWGALDYLADAVRLSTTDMQDPAKALEILLDSNRSQALGEAIQRTLGSIPTDRSANDGILAAIHLGLDPESIEQPRRNTVAGFNLAADRHWGTSPASVIDELAKHLSEQGKTSPATAELGARLLLAQVAPQYLVKDIPATVVYGSQAWANLCIAVAAIEAQTPGKAMQMDFAEVMRSADDTEPAGESAQKAALIDWGVVNGFLYAKDDTDYNNAEIEYTREAFNTQQSELSDASRLQGTTLPSRKQMALDLLKATFGDGDYFEDRVLRINYQTGDARTPRYSDAYSMLDIAMQGLKIDAADWQVIPAHKNINLDTLASFTQSTAFNIPETFDTAFNQALDNIKQVKKYAFISALDRLPLADRTQLNYGKLTFYKENDYRISLIPTVKDELFHTSPKILIHSEYQGKTQTYEFNSTTGTLYQVDQSRVHRPNQYVSNEVNKVEVLSIGGYRDSAGAEEKAPSYPTFNTFQSQRSHYIAAVINRALGFDDPAVKQYAAGSTPSEARRAWLSSTADTLLNLIPLKSAITNFRNGQYKDGAIDLAFDVFGFVTAGIGLTAKVGKAVTGAGSTLGKLAQGGKILGVTTFNAFNPLSGTGDLAVGAGRLVTSTVNAGAQGIRKLRGTAGNLDLITASQYYEAAATGIFDVGAHRVEGSAVRQQGKWYAFDSNTMQPYGPALDTFTPTHTLMPPSPTLKHPVRSSRDHRFNPISQKSRPPRDPLPAGEPVEQIRKTDHLPSTEYLGSIRGNPSHAHFTPSRKQATREKFTQDMRDFYTRAAAGAQPARPTLPDIPTPKKTNDVIADAFDTAPGLVFGESHSNLAAFRTLYDNVDLFVQNKVKKLFVEGVVYDKDMRLIDDGMGRVGLHHRPPGQRPTLKELFKKFEDHGIEIVPLDHGYLTRHNDERHLFGAIKTHEQAVQRLEEFNYYATRTIEQHAGGDKWVALVGRHHVNTTQNVPGLAELTGSTGIAVYERSGRSTYGIRSADERPGPSGTLTPLDDLTGDLQIFAGETWPA